MQLWSTQSCFWMVLPHNKCRNNTITTIGVMYSSYCQSWSTSCLQIFVKGRLLWQLRLLSKSSGMEHLHPLCDLGLYGGLFQTERCSVFENNNNTTIKSSFPHFFLGQKKKQPGASPRNAEESTEFSNNFKVLWHFNAWQTEWELCSNNCKGQVLTAASWRERSAQLNPAILGLLNIWPFF